MTIRVDLNPEIEARLVAEARSQGLPLEKLAERLLKEALTASSLPHGVLTVDEFHRLKAWQRDRRSCPICRRKASRAKASMRTG